MDNATQVLVGPDMPQAVDSHCFIKIFNDLALTIGGKTGEKLPSKLGQPTFTTFSPESGARAQIWFSTCLDTLAEW